MTQFVCRACGSTQLTSFVDLGITPLANSMVPFANEDAGEVCYPLHAFVCRDCFLVQLGEFTSREAIFSDDYTYFSSFSEGWVTHAKTYAASMSKRFGLGEDAHICEVASNDGYLLQWFKHDGKKGNGH